MPDYRPRTHSNTMRKWAIRYFPSKPLSIGLYRFDVFIRFYTDAFTHTGIHFWDFNLNVSSRMSSKCAVPVVTNRHKLSHVMIVVSIINIDNFVLTSYYMLATNLGTEYYIMAKGKP